MHDISERAVKFTRSHKFSTGAPLCPMYCTTRHMRASCFKFIASCIVHSPHDTFALRTGTVLRWLQPHIVSSLSRRHTCTPCSSGSKRNGTVMLRYGALEPASNRSLHNFMRYVDTKKVFEGNRVRASCISDQMIWSPSQNRLNSARFWNHTHMWDITYLKSILNVYLTGLCGRIDNFHKVYYM